MGELWAQEEEDRLTAASPLADRIRPASLDEVVGQDDLLGPEGLLRRLMTADRMGSLLLWGPPGTGKTTIASLIARQSGKLFLSANAALIGVREIRDAIEQSRRRLREGKPGVVLFLDELHRFARNQQDVLLGDVERGVLTLIGATTENPWYAVTAALASRSTVLKLAPLDEADIRTLLRRALERDPLLRSKRPTVSQRALDLWATRCDGDARRALNALEIAVLGRQVGDGSEIDEVAAAESLQTKALRYDRAGQDHADHISALIKAVRGSDADAAVHWLAVMLASGEDPRFICRRLAILASEDVGLASPQALQMAAAAWTITERVGMPECQLTLAELVIYLATCPKSDASAQAIWTAMRDVESRRTDPVPPHLRSGTDGSANAETAAYVNPHRGGSETDSQSYREVSEAYFAPSDRGFEREIRKRMTEGENDDLR